MNAIQTIGDLINRLQEYYDLNYNETQIQDIKDWFVAENIFDNMAQGFYNLIVDNFKSYKSLPGRKDLNDIKNMSIEQKAENAWMSLNKLTFVRSFICTDVVVQETIKAMGGIDIFVGYKNDNNTFAHKDFVKHYTRLLRTGFFKNTKPEPLLCEQDRMYPKYPQDYFVQSLMIIGDQTKGKILLEDALQSKQQIEHKETNDFKSGKEIFKLTEV